MNNHKKDLATTPERDRSELNIENVRQRGGMFVEAVRLTRMPMLITDATLPKNPIIFANNAFVELSGYAMDELVGQDPHFMNGPGTDPEAVAEYQDSMSHDLDATLEILQYRKNGEQFRAMLFASPVDDGQGTVTNHFLSYLDITRRYEAEKQLRLLASELETRVADRTDELTRANEALAKIVAERDVLMIEVNHRAKNSLATAASLLSIQGRRQSDPHVRQMFEEACDRLHAMARVHDLLSKSEREQRVELSTYTSDLCEALRPITDTDHRIRLEVRADEHILVSPDTAIPLGIILTELVTNAVKYAYPAPRSGTILVTIGRTISGLIEVSVRDDGVGVAQVREGSLGFGLVRSLVQQIGGTLELQHERGLTAAVWFPDGADVLH
jgi:PAS domain S-box-containing protein